VPPVFRIIHRHSRLREARPRLIVHLAPGTLDATDC